MTLRGKRGLPQAGVPPNPATQTFEAPGTAHAFSLPKRWRLIRPLGRGGQAEVWLALDREIDQMVAVKVFDEDLSADATRRFRREVLLGRTLEHTNLARIFELIDTGSRLAIAMQWYPRGSLADAPGTVQPIPRVVSIAAEVLEALAYLHNREIVHRDIKPSNLLIADDQNVVLGDLGLARSFSGETGWTQTLTTAGTPRFMSPEQLLGQRPGPPSDLYSLGVTLFLLLTGRLPFEGESDFETADRQLHSRPANPRRLRPDCPRWLARFILRLLEKAPRDRWPDAEAALVALKRRRFLGSPRLRRRSAVVFLALASAVGTLIIAVPHLGRTTINPALRLVSHDRQVACLGPNGHVEWRFSCRSRVRQVLRGHLTGSRDNQIVIATAPTLGGAVRASTPRLASVVVLNSSGDLISELLPEEEVRSRGGNPIAPPLLVPRAVLADLDGDGRQEIIVTCHHRTLGTAYLFIYWPRADVWRLVLGHSGGWIFNVTSVPRTGTTRLRFFAFNGILASEEVVGELSLPPPGSSARTEGSACIPGVQPMDGAELIWYTPLGQAFPGPAEGAHGFICNLDGVSDIHSQGRHWSIDRWGNPIPGPNAGRNLSESRVELLRQLGNLQGAPFSEDPASIARRSRSLRKRFASLLGEPPTHAIFALMLSRAYACSGAYQEAKNVLVRAWSKQHNDDLGLSLAHIEAVAGHLHDATITLQKTIHSAITPAGIFRAPQLLFYVAIEKKDPKLLHESARLSQDFAHNRELMDVIEARARLWWNRPTAPGASLRSYDLAPAGEAIACLTRWRLGSIRKTDPKAMSAAIKQNPDAIGEGLLARAMARTVLGEPTRGLADLDELEQRLAPTAPYDFRSFQVLQLAKACRAKVLLAAGRTTEALTLARKLLPTLHPGLLPRVVVEEVLAAGTHGRDPAVSATGRLPKIAGASAGGA